MAYRRPTGGGALKVLFAVNRPGRIAVDAGIDPTTARDLSQEILRVEPGGTLNARIA